MYVLDIKTMKNCKIHCRLFMLFGEATQNLNSTISIYLFEKPSVFVLYTGITEHQHYLSTRIGTTVQYVKILAPIFTQSDC